MKKSSYRPPLGSPAVSPLIKSTYIPLGIPKLALDIRSRQLYPENNAYWRSRHIPRPDLKTVTR